jgi:F-type H+-transporting ATPase subunit b
MKSLISRRSLAVWVLLALACIPVRTAATQQGPSEPSPSQSQTSDHNTQAQSAKGAAEHSESSPEATPGGANAAAAGILENASEKAAHRAEIWGRPFGLGHDASFAISLALNFAGIAAVFYVLLKAKLPQMFRDRTSAIQKALREAQAASAEATARLSAIEARLAKMDSEVSEIRSGAEREAAAEEERIRAAAEEDKQKVVSAAEAEIAAIARSARHDLKSFAASLAVDLAARKIKVDDNTDHALVNQFVGHLGKDGQ